jgi:uncharacterized membrane protein YbhN (UPF0104 family)
VRLLGRRPPTWALVVAGLATGLVAAVAVAATVDTDALGDAWRTASGDPVGLAVVAGALLGAFAVRAAAWRAMVPAIGFGHALAAIHVTLGANHVLPFRLGEPMRVASVVRRARVPVTAATASTVALRLADVVSLVAIGVVASPAAFSRLLGPWGWVVSTLAGVAALVAWRWLRRLATSDEHGLTVRPATVVLTAAAWVLEALAVWQALRWTGIDVDARGALLVTAAAVGAQVAAVAPSGFGTYEAAATAALVSLGHDPGLALAAALTTHAAKTAYSLVSGAVALAVPRPGLLATRAPGGATGLGIPAEIP